MSRGAKELLGYLALAFQLVTLPGRGWMHVRSHFVHHHKWWCHLPNCCRPDAPFNSSLSISPLLSRLCPFGGGGTLETAQVAKPPHLQKTTGIIIARIKTVRRCVVERFRLPDVLLWAWTVHEVKPQRVNIWLHTKIELECARWFIFRLF